MARMVKPRNGDYSEDVIDVYRLGRALDSDEVSDPQWVEQTRAALNALLHLLMTQKKSNAPARPKKSAA